MHKAFSWMLRVAAWLIEAGDAARHPHITLRDQASLRKIVTTLREVAKRIGSKYEP